MVTGELPVIMEWLMSYAIFIMGLVGVLAFLVSVIVETTKNLPFLSKMPTDLQVIMTSIILCEVMLFAYASWQEVLVRWHFVALAFFMSLVVSFIAMFGWSKIYVLYSRFVKKKE